MSRPRLTFQRGLLVSMIAALTTWITLFAWRGFVTDSGNYLGPLFTLGLVIALIGALARWARVPLVAVVLLQVVAVGAWLLGLYGEGSMPTADSIDAVVSAFGDAIHSAQAYAAPVPSSVASATPLLVAGGAACLIMVDFLAVGLGRVPLAGLPLLLIYSLPVSIIDKSVNWILFVMVAAGFLMLLFLREDERFAQWGRQVQADPRSADPSGFGVRTGTARSNALAIGGTVTALALFVPALIPELEVSLFSGGVGNGPGHGVSIVNPITDLRRDLHRGTDVPLLTVTSSEGRPSYLKVSVLANFNGEAWTTGDRKIPGSQVANGLTMPPLPGLNTLLVRTTPYSLELSATDDLESHWLPVPELVTSANAPGSWKYDTGTRDFVSGDATQTSEGLTWTATGVNPTFDASRLAAAPPAPSAIMALYTSLPIGGIPQSVRDLAFGVTEEAPTPYQKAVALQDWFRGPAGGFKYSLDVSQANGSEALEQFLSTDGDGRRGYCEQFASAFAVMARALDIPTRVVVGFLNADQIGANSYQFSAHDLHAWPEVYFEGAGWVRFEPTPGNGATVPGYTREQVIGGPSLPTSSASQTGSALPTSRPANPTTAPSGSDQASGAGSGVSWGILAGVAAGLLVLTGLALVPRTLRRSRRRGRWSIGTAEAAWAELRDTVRDLGLPWPDGRSPQATGTAIAPLLAAADGSVRPPQGRAANPEAAAALDRLVGALELERYSGRPLVVDPAELEADVTCCTESLSAGVPASTRRRAVWLPRSLRQPTMVGDGLTRTRSARGGVIDHVS